MSVVHAKGCKRSPPGFPVGLVLSLAATVLVLLFFLAANWVRRPVAQPRLQVTVGGEAG